MTPSSDDDQVERQAQAQYAADRLLSHCQPVEPEIMLDTAWRKRTGQVPPTDISQAALQRYIQLGKAHFPLPLDGQTSIRAYQNLAELLWNRLTEPEQNEWLLQVK